MASVKYGPKVCTICGKEYQGIFNSRYCSKECKEKRNLLVWHEKNPRPTCKRICLTCGKEFVAESQNQQTCSLTCRKKRYAEDWKKSYNRRMSVPVNRERKRELVHENYAQNKDSLLSKQHERIIQKKREIAQTLQIEPVIENNNGNIKQDYIDTLGIKRLSAKGCECLRCGNKFNIIRAEKSAVKVLNRLSLTGESPCPYCGESPTGTSLQRNSTPQHEIKRLFPNFTEMNYRPDWMDGMEIDLYDPVAKVGLEYHGMRWHSTATMDNATAARKHRRKADLCEAHGVQLIQLYETEWVQKREIVIDRLNAIFHKPMRRVFARKLNIMEITGDKSVGKFMETNHIQGTCPTQYSLGLYDGLELVAVCTFKYGTAYASGGMSGNTEKYWELNRYATKLNVSVVGGLSKCVKRFFRKHPDIDKVVSFADRRWTSPLRTAYGASGFIEAGRCPPNYVYTDLNPYHALKNKQYMRKSNIAKRGETCYSPDKTETEMSRELGYYKIYDAGKIRYEIRR